MHLQAVDTTREKIICPYCRVLQNVDVASHDEETDLLAGQLCWYCGHALFQDELTHGSDFKIVLPADEVPSEKEGRQRWEQALEREYGGRPKNFHFDMAGRCLVTLRPVKTTDDLDEPLD